ncbi:MAG: glycosyl hydrolase [Alistipes sp.]|nr:glycosyl hydrolase [Alistipes sp.]
MRRSLLSALFIMLCGLSFAQQKHQAQSAYDFLQSIGVNSAIYRRGESVERTIECVNYIGARWIRTDESMHTDEQVAAIKQLTDATGVKISTSLGSGGSDIEELILGSQRMAQMGVLLAIEGNNEPNNWGIRYNGQEGGRDKSWVAVARLHRDLYQAVKSDDVLRRYPVWATTETGAMTDNVGLQYLEVPNDATDVVAEFRGARFADIANCHNYFVHPAWAAPKNNQTWLSSLPTSVAKGDHLQGNYGVTWLKKYKGYSDEELQQLPRVTTETGATISGQMTEEMQARMYLSCYLSQFTQGWSHTAMYILRDRSDEAGNQSFGFYDKDYRPRKAALYLHNLTTLLDDDQPTKRLSSVAYTIENQSAEVHDLLLQKSDGSFALIIWGELYEGGEQTVTVRLKRKYDIRIFNPTVGTTPSCEGRMDNFDLRVTTHPYIIELR